MVDVTPVLQEYTRTMREAQLFEAALQVVAATELELPERELTSEELRDRTERFFSRGIGWIQRRLEVSPELAQEIDALRRARNELAHGYLLRLAWLGGDDSEAQQGATVEQLLPERLRQDFNLLMKMVGEEHATEARATLAELRSLRARFAACVADLTSRWVSNSGLSEVSTLAEVERLIRETG
jgi:hypothetical protein